MKYHWLDKLKMKRCCNILEVKIFPNRLQCTQNKLSNLVKILLMHVSLATGLLLLNLVCYCRYERKPRHGHIQFMHESKLKIFTLPLTLAHRHTVLSR
jgi:hypothetical protein